MSKISDFWSQHQSKFILSLGGILIATASFGVGRLTVLEKSEPIAIKEPSDLSGNTDNSVNDGLEEGGDVPNTESPEEDDQNSKSENPGKYIASQNGTRYYLPDCSGVKRIKEKNKVWFDSIEEAEAEGLEPAKRCEGL